MDGRHGQQRGWQRGDEGWPAQTSLDHKNESSVSALVRQRQSLVAAPPDAMQAGLEVGGVPATGDGRAGWGWKTAERRREDSRRWWGACQPVSLFGRPS